MIRPVASQVTFRVTDADAFNKLKDLPQVILQEIEFKKRLLLFFPIDTRNQFAITEVGLCFPSFCFSLLWLLTYYRPFYRPYSKGIDHTVDGDFLEKVDFKGPVIYT